jgi:hypothetical protein
MGVAITLIGGLNGETVWPRTKPRSTSQLKHNLAAYQRPSQAAGDSFEVS